jgi:hypothetical protein
MHWVLYHAGLTDPNSPYYLFFSGVGADFTRISAIFTGVSIYIHHHRKKTK